MIIAKIFLLGITLSILFMSPILLLIPMLSPACVALMLLQQDICLWSRTAAGGSSRREEHQTYSVPQNVVPCCFFWFSSKHLPSAVFNVVSVRVGISPWLLALMPHGKKKKSLYDHSGLCAPGPVQVPCKKHQCSVVGLPWITATRVHSCLWSSHRWSHVKAWASQTVAASQNRRTTLQPTAQVKQAS